MSITILLMINPARNPTQFRHFRLLPGWKHRVFSSSGMSLGRAEIGDAKRVDMLQKTAVQAGGMVGYSRGTSTAV
ncbi:MAG: hypothetical protein LH632_22495 [Rhodoferax sp.]|nr:hypothetical protein [Rhodoferax sp.]